VRICRTHTSAYVSGLHTFLLFLFHSSLLCYFRCLLASLACLCGRPPCTRPAAPYALAVLRFLRFALGDVCAEAHSIGQDTSAYVSVCQHTSAYVSIRRTCGEALEGAYALRLELQHRLVELHYLCVSGRQHTSAYVSIRQHTSAYVSIRQHRSA
jgi:hypothetical protein